MYDSEWNNLSRGEYHHIKSYARNGVKRSGDIGESLKHNDHGIRLANAINKPLSLYPKLTYLYKKPTAYLIASNEYSATDA